MVELCKEKYKMSSKHTRSNVQYKSKIKLPNNHPKLEPAIEVVRQPEQKSKFTSDAFVMSDMASCLQSYEECGKINDDEVLYYNEDYLDSLWSESASETESSILDSGASFMSWNDEIEVASTEALQATYNDIEEVLYNEPSGTSLSSNALAECQLWKETFPHLRIVGTSIERLEELPETFQVLPDDVEPFEEVLASHGINSCLSDKSEFSFPPNDEFSENGKVCITDKSKEYLEEKIRNYVFEELFSEVLNEVMKRKEMQYYNSHKQSIVKMKGSKQCYPRTVSNSSSKKRVTENHSPSQKELDLLLSTSSVRKFDRDNKFNDSRVTSRKTSHSSHDTFSQYQAPSVIPRLDKFNSHSASYRVIGYSNSSSYPYNSRRSSAIVEKQLRFPAGEDKLIEKKQKNCKMGEEAAAASPVKWSRQTMLPPLEGCSKPSSLPTAEKLSSGKKSETSASRPGTTTLRKKTALSPLGALPESHHVRNFLQEQTGISSAVSTSENKRSSSKLKKNKTKQEQ